MHPLVNLAKLAVENYIKEGKLLEPPDNLPAEFYEKMSGVFVTIEKEGQLRACIGTYLPTRPDIARELIYNAVAAASEDYRFGPIQPAELAHLSYTVYILSYPEPIEDNKALNPQKFGVIVKTGPLDPKNKTFDGITSYKTGLLLPNLPGIDTAEKQISIACQKAGINPQKEKIFIYRFTAEKYHE
jgi:AmmeMemoRadiSam system protein A